MPDPISESESSAPPPRPEDFKGMQMPIVGIGASAGGLETLIQFFGALPGDIGMAFVVVVHLDPNHESRFAELMAKGTSLTVAEAREGDMLAAGHVYVIPPNTTVAIEGGTLRIEARREVRGPHLPVDHFLRSLAEDQRAASIAIILSGTGSDGTLGLAEVKAAGGITFAQEPASAKYDGMPASAVASGRVDFVLPLLEIPRELLRLAAHPYLVHAGTEAVADEATFRRIGSLVRASYGVDIQHYRPTTMRRRMLRRMALRNHDDLASYSSALAQDPVEVAALYEDLMISVTSFFRDPELFEALKSGVFPDLLERKAGETIRVWVVGCSTGQEAYSIAMALTEFLEGKPRAPGIQIFATDVNENTSLSRARAGLYPPSIEAEVSPERLRRFFRKEENGGYRVHKSIRDLCVFAKQNVMSDPPFSKLDILTCRNVLIYLSSATQKVVVPTFHYALAPGGYLVLGSSETASAYSDLFTIVDREHKIYTKLGGSMRHYPHFGHEQHESHATSARQVNEYQPSSTEWQREADRVAMGAFVPASILVDANLEIIEFRGDMGRYLAPHPGEASLNLLRMVREGLSLKLKDAIAEAGRTNAVVHAAGIRLWEDSAARVVGLEVMPLRIQSSPQRCFLVFFQEDGPDRSRGRGTAGSRATWFSRLAERLSGPVPRDNPEAAALRDELDTARLYLQSILEQREAANEELRSANEEILSSNEELQSTNEELQTTKEELQSLNEELTTVNEQLHHRNVDLNTVNNDLENLFTSARVPVVMVDRDLRIRRFSHSAGHLLNLMAADIGRPLRQIKPRLELDDLDSLLTHVVDRVETLEREVRSIDGRSFLLRLHPYRTVDNRIDGAVLVLFDIHEMKSVEARYQRERELSEAIVETVREPLLVLDERLRVKRSNRSYCELFGVRKSEIEGRELFELGEGEWNLPSLRGLLESGVKDSNTVNNLEVDHEFARIGRRVLSLNVRRLQLAAGMAEPFLLLAIEDVTERRLKQRGLEEADRNKDEFMAVLSHELRNPLAAIGSAVKMARLPDLDRAQVEWSHDVIDRQVTNMVRLIDDLMDVARVSKGKIDLQPVPLDLAEVVRDAVEEARPLLERFKHTITVQLEPERIPIVADRTRLVQVLVNLVTNAAKYTDAGGRIWIEARAHAGGVVITVQDDGIGMAPALLPRVFEAFVQADHSMARAQGGLGLGLTLVKRIVELHGGTVAAASDGPGRGSLFTMRLPAPTSIVLNDEVMPRAPAPRALARRRVLLAEDNEDTLKAMSLYLQSHGHAVLTANDGPDAFELVVREKPDVAVLDLGLPTMSGYALAERIRRTGEVERIQLIAVSGYGRDEDKSRAREAGFDLHFTKPVDHARLLAAIQDGPASKSSLPRGQ